MAKHSSPVRLDRRLVNERIASSLDEAQRLIVGGRVLVEGQSVTSRSAWVKPEASVRLFATDDGWVGRGAYKLLRALDSFELDLSGRVCLDVGASTGGFTQVMLRAGAARVYALDVGYGQLAWVLRQDRRVTVMDRCNGREMKSDWFSPSPSFVASDASFISLTALLSPICRSLLPSGEAVVLVKPQFEAPPDAVGPGGIVVDSAVHLAALRRVRDFAAAQTDFGLLGAVPSSIRGTKGNREFLFYFKRNCPSMPIDLETLVHACGDEETVRIDD